MKTATDVLRLSVAMSDGDVSLGDKTHFKKFSRPERKMILGMLDTIDTPLEDMKRHRTKWLRLGEKLHPGEYKNRFTNASHIFHILRNRPETIETFNKTI